MENGAKAGAGGAPGSEGGNGEARYHAVVPDVEYYRQLISCMDACPVSTDAGGYVHATFRGRDEEAYELAQKPNPLATICARICAHPCESACRRGKIDAPVSIRALKRFVTEQYGVENPRRFSEFIGTIAPREAGEGAPGVRYGEKVAIIGAGPAGLSCAYELARWGYGVTVFEASRFGGGMVRLGVPEYRLSRDLIEMEVRRVLSWGVSIEYEKRLGEDISLKGLREQGFDAVLIAIGAFASRAVNIPGADLDGVMNGLEFLLNINQGYQVSIGKRVAVIGGGNVAIDVARTALRESAGGETETAGDGARQREVEDTDAALHSKALLDTARSALRLGARDVHIISLESRDEMPAHFEEIEDAVSEGIHLHPARAVKKIIGNGGGATALELVECLSVFDEQGRFAPKLRSGDGESFPVDTVLLATGQSIDRSSFKLDPELGLNSNGSVKVDPETLETTIAGVFSGGDVAFGPRNVISAVADGTKAALSIHRKLRRGKIPAPRAWFTESGHYLPPRGNEMTTRQAIPCVPVARRTGFREVELGYDEDGARREAGRCLHCHVNTVFDSDLCILCGGCVDVCPEYCFRIVGASKLERTEEIAALLESEGADGLPSETGPETAYAILKDEDTCTRCALCAERCPTGAITMELFTYRPQSYTIHETA